MSSTEIAIKVLGYIASICIPLAFLPQTLKTIIKKETKGISIISYSIFLLGCIGFLIFGIYAKDIPMIICEVITGFFSIIILIIAIINHIKIRKNPTAESKEGEES